MVELIDRWKFSDVFWIRWLYVIDRSWFNDRKWKVIGSIVNL